AYMQTSYSINQAAAIPGMIADSSGVKDIVSFKNPNGKVYFGRLVTRDSAVDEVKHPTTAAGVSSPLVVRGVVVAAHEIESVEDGEDPGYAAKSVVPVMTKGRIWVKAISAVTEGTSEVHVYWAGSNPLGGFRGSVDSSFTAVFPYGKWKDRKSKR